MTHIPSVLPASAMKYPVDDIPLAKTVVNNENYYKPFSFLTRKVNDENDYVKPNVNKDVADYVKSNANVMKEITNENKFPNKEVVEISKPQPKPTFEAANRLTPAPASTKFVPPSSAVIAANAVSSSGVSSAPVSTNTTTINILNEEFIKLQTKAVTPAPAEHNIRLTPAASTSTSALNLMTEVNNNNTNKFNRSSPSLNLNKIGTVEKIHKMLDKSYSTTAVSEPFVPSSLSSPKNNVWVVRYIDYTSKYGLGFLFNNGSAGVYFNDSTKIVLSADGKYFQYIERRKECSFGSEHSSQKFSIEAYPADLQKKVTLLKHFKNYLLEEEAKNPRSMNHEQNADLQALKSAFSKDYNDKNFVRNGTIPNDMEDEPELPFLKKWVKTKHAILFRISNRTVQVIFYDRR